MPADEWIVLTAPVSGVMVSLADVPDPVFSSRMVGDGVSIDPTSTRLLAPCPGTVTMLHAAGHAVTLTHPTGLEIMLHIGIDTVSLNGVGFRPQVQVGQAVEAGDLLIEFDADTVALQARSLLTQVLLMPRDRVAATESATGTVSANREAVLRVRLKERRTVEAASGDDVVSREVVIHYPHGLHARPAAVLAALAGRWPAEIQLARGRDRANVKSVVSVMALQVQSGQKVRFVARGEQAAEAVDALVANLAAGLGEDLEAEPLLMLHPGKTGNLGLRGQPASPGIAVGRVFHLRRTRRDLTERAGDAKTERRRLQVALDQAAVELQTLERRMAFLADDADAAIFSAHRQMLQDPDLTDPVWQAVAAGQNAAYAWQQACSAQAARLSALDDARMATHASDVRDIGERVLRLLLGDGGAPEIPTESLVIADELTPSETAAMDRGRVVGLVTLLGGPTSHSAILARSLELPAVVAMDPRAATLEDGVLAILDGTRGTLRVEPSPAEVAESRVQQTEVKQRRQHLLASSSLPAALQDGRTVEVLANLGQVSEADTAVRMGADGVGLLRSEFLFLGRSEPPTEEQQATAYIEIAQTLGPRRSLIIRTLDVGGDKPLAYLGMPTEPNPFLGERGLRLTLAHPDLFREQLRAILRAAEHTRLGIMLPMVTTLEELLEARGLVEEEMTRLGTPKVPLGVMIEVPAAALTADRLAQEADFFSIGTNDLAQYTLAVDRGHPRLGGLVDSLHPAVLRLVQETVQAAHAHGRKVSVCGSMAGDPQGIPLLLGLGVDELSVAVPSIPAVKAAIRELREADCKTLAAQALTLHSAAEVRALI